MGRPMNFLIAHERCGNMVCCCFGSTLVNSKKQSLFHHHFLVPSCSRNGSGAGLPTLPAFCSIVISWFLLVPGGVRGFVSPRSIWLKIMILHPEKKLRGTLLAPPHQPRSTQPAQQLHLQLHQQQVIRRDQMTTLAGSAAGAPTIA